MADPQNISMDAAYFIYRDIPAGEPFDPTAALLFYPAKGSDELFDALRFAFPHLKTHSERMRDAIIQFLLEERHQEELQISPSVTMDTSWPSVPPSSGSASLLSTPETFNLATPSSFVNSPQPALLTRQTSLITSSQPTPPSLDQMTGVFSLTSSQPKQRIRRKMTEAEKIEYRKRRIVKACDKCARRKRKCPHNQNQMDTISTASGAKSSKATPHGSNHSVKASANNKSARVEDFTPADGPGVFTNNIDADAFQSFDDFQMFDDDLPDLDLNDYLDFNVQNKFYRPSDMFTPDISPSVRSWAIDPRFADDNLSFDCAETVARSAANVNQSSGNGILQQSRAELQSPRRPEDGRQVYWEPSSRQVSHLTGESIQEIGSLSQQDGQSDIQHGATALRNRTSDRPPRDNNEQGVPERLDHSGRNNCRSGQQDAQQPTHTAHVHNAGCGELFGLADANGAPKEQYTGPDLAQTTLRLVGTTKALRKLLSLRQSRPSSSPSTQPAISIERAAAVLGTDCKRPYNLTVATNSAVHTRPTRPGKQSSHLDRQSIPAPSASTHSIGEGITNRSTDMSTELFMLRRRVSSNLGRNRFGTAVKYNVISRAESKTAFDSQANGGAYPRLETSAIGRQRSHFNKTDARLVRHQQNKSSTPRKTDQLDGHGDRTTTTGNKVPSNQHNIPPRALAGSAGRGAPLAINDARNVSFANTVDHGVASVGNSTYVERLSDHVRYRDHHGRRLQQLLGVLLLAALSAFTRVSPLFVLCASLFADRVPSKTSIVHCTQKNSSWLSVEKTLLSSKASSDAFSHRNEQRGSADTIGGAWMGGMLSSLIQAPLRWPAVFC